MKTTDALPDDYTVCIVGHGSKNKDGLKEFLTLSSKFKKREPNRIMVEFDDQVGEPQAGHHHHVS
mgnify:FL=1